MRAFAFACALAISTSCMAADKTRIFDEIREADQAFFAAFNACDLETMGKMFSEDLEFYHDMSGHAGYAETMESTKKNCDNRLGLVRELVDDSMSVHPLGEFGAIQKGRHTFCHMADGKKDCGTFEFLHIWKRDRRDWRLHRVVSYGH